MRNTTQLAKTIIIATCIALLIGIIYSLGFLKTTPAAKAFDFFGKYNSFQRISDSNYDLSHADGNYVVLDDGRVLFNREIFDPESESFIPADHYYFSGKKIKLNNGYVLVFGVPGKGTYRIYDPKTNKIIQQTDFVIKKRDYYSAILLSNNKVLVVGGYEWQSKSQNPYILQAEIFDPETGKAYLTGSLSYKRIHPCLLPLDNSNVLVLGGVQDSKHNYAELYNPTTNNFMLASNIDFPIGGDRDTYKLSNGKVMIFGKTGGQIRPKLLNTETGNFEFSGRLNNETRTFFSTARLPDGRVLVMGGTIWGGGQGGPPIKTTEIYDPVTNKFTPFKNLAIPGQGVAITLKDGSILIVGQGKTGKEAQIFRYHK